MSVDLSPEEFQKLGVTAIANIAEQLLSFREPGSVRMPVPADLKSRILGQLLPEDGVDPDQLLQRVHDDLFPYPMGNAHPRFFAWVNSPPAPFGILGDLLASALNPSVAGGDHAATYVEHVVLRWLKEMLSYPVQAGAVLTSGGSAANLVCLGAMRHVMTEGRVRADGMDQSVNPLVVYVSEQGHSCIRKALEILGFGSRHIRTISCDDEFRFDVSALRKSIVLDVEAGLRPVCVAASAGTVNTGAIDPLDQIADLCQEFGLWFHIDGAYGAVGQLDTRLAELYTGLKRADSLAVDPHKWLYIPVD
jgi:glutamate/tyrosine decarboxylase-like PLP-dependent enzyme